MKKIAFFALVLLIPFVAIAQAQDPWIGDWTSESYSDIDWDASNATKDATGTIQEVIHANFRLVIRIQRTETNTTPGQKH